MPVESHAESRLPVPDPDELLTTAEVAVVLKCSAKHVRKLCRLPDSDRQHLAHVKKGAEYLIPRQSITDWIARQIGRI